MNNTQDSIICQFCRDPFIPKKKWQKFCSNKCRDNFHNDKKYEEPVKCPHCTNSAQSMLEKLSDSVYLCEVCAKEFEV